MEDEEVMAQLTELREVVAGLPPRGTLEQNIARSLAWCKRSHDYAVQQREERDNAGN